MNGHDYHQQCPELRYRYHCISAPAMKRETFIYKSVNPGLMTCSRKFNFLFY